MFFSSAANLPTEHGIFRICAARDGQRVEHAIVFKGELRGARNLPVRIHSQCATSEVFGSLRCDCDEQLRAALAFFEAEGRGLLIYLNQEGRGIGLFNKIEAYALQDAGFDTVEANHQLGLSTDARSYQFAVQILKELGVESVRLLTNNPRKLEALCDSGIEISQRIPLHAVPNDHNSSYLATKKRKLAHLL